MILCESMSNFPPVYEPLEPWWLPAACWSVEIHTAAGKGGQHTGLPLWPPARWCGWRPPTPDHRTSEYQLDGAVGSPSPTALAPGEETRQQRGE